MLKLIFLFFASIIHVYGQQVFLSSVKIRYERTFAISNVIRILDPENYEKNKQYIPKNQISYFDFLGNEKYTSYVPIPEGNQVDAHYADFYVENQVFTNLENQTVTIFKNFLSGKYQIADSTLKIKWRLTGDKRVISGYNCRKAVGTINNQVTIFAFYTDNIVIAGGPESIHGLPGMILGVGVPSIHTTWFATSVKIANSKFVSTPDIDNNKKLTRNNFYSIAASVLSKLGSFSKLITMSII